MSLLQFSEKETQYKCPNVTNLLPKSKNPNVDYAIGSTEIGLGLNKTINTFQGPGAVEQIREQRNTGYAGEQSKARRAEGGPPPYLVAAGVGPRPRSLAAGAPGHNRVDRCRR